MKICIIGGGWYGSHLAITLSERGHTVTILEKNDRLFAEVSGKFGVRLHTGPHYPRSFETRRNCHNNFEKFCAKYSALLVHHNCSIYALGKNDSDGLEPKIDKLSFEKVCQEFHYKEELYHHEWLNFENLQAADDIDEPSVVVGQELRSFFEEQMIKHSINVIYNFDVKEIRKEKNIFIIKNRERDFEFPVLINASGFKSFVPNVNLPMSIVPIYQVCLALEYEDKVAEEKPFSLIIMDGWFPCLMPVTENKLDNRRKYILTHGKWTILESSKSYHDSQEILRKIDDKFVDEYIKSKCEADILKFFPGFNERFSYVGWRGEVLVKLLSNTEYRSAITFSCDDIVHIIPGKISDVFECEEEIQSLIMNERVIDNNTIRYVNNGTLYRAERELKQKIEKKERNTGYLHSFNELTNENTELSTSKYSFFAKGKEVYSISYKTEANDPLSTLSL